MKKDPSSLGSSSFSWLISIATLSLSGINLTILEIPWIDSKLIRQTVQDQDFHRISANRIFKSFSFFPSNLIVTSLAIFVVWRFRNCFTTIIKRNYIVPALSWKLIWLAYQTPLTSIFFNSPHFKYHCFKIRLNKRSFEVQSEVSWKLCNRTHLILWILLFWK